LQTDLLTWVILAGVAASWVEREMNWTHAADEFEAAMREFFPQVFSGVKEAG
jgi:hypothetical protein